MKSIKLTLITLFMFFSSFAMAVEENSLPALRGYDPVSYHTIGRPVMGNGNHVSKYQGQHYLFISKANKEKFEKNPERYAPAYGGWCAFGIAVKKKFHGDPLVWEIVNNRLFINLDNKIKGMWLKDIPGHTKKADKNWKRISNHSVSSL